MNTRKIALITEQEKEFGEQCRNCLEEKGFEVIQSPRDGVELLRMIRETSPSVVVMTDQTLFAMACWLVRARPSAEMKKPLALLVGTPSVRSSSVAKESM